MKSLTEKITCPLNGAAARSRRLEPTYPLRRWRGGEEENGEGTPRRGRR